MGWRNVAYSALDDAEKNLKEARKSLNEILVKPGEAENFVRQLLLVSEAIDHAIGLAIDDGIPTLIKYPKNAQ
jgi:hypothetical protein